MELQDYIAIIRRRLWILVTVPVLAAMASGVLSYFVLTPVYQASATIWVVTGNRSPLNMEDLMFNRNLVRTYTEVAKSRYILQQVMDRLGLPQGVPELQKRLKVSGVDQTEVLRITVEDSDPHRAATIANGVAVAFSEEIEKFVRLENIQILDRALPPSIPEKPRKMLNMLLGVGIGGVTALALVFLLEALDLTIRTRSDVRRHLGLPVLGTITAFHPGKMKLVQPDPTPTPEQKTGPTAGPLPGGKRRGRRR